MDATLRRRSLALTIQGSRGSTVREKERSRAVFGYNDLKSTLFTVETDADLFVLGSIGQPFKSGGRCQGGQCIRNQRPEQGPKGLR